MIFNWRRAILVAAVLAAGGCSKNYTPAPPSDLSVARAALEKALDCWKLRIDTSELVAAKPALYVRDEDRSAQHRLVEYQLLPGEEPSGNAIRWPVRLRVQRTDGREEDLQVLYVITTSPVIHIGRQD